MRHQDMRREPAVDLDAEMARCGTEVLFARVACGALTAADPGKHRERLSNRHVGIRSGLLGHAGNLMAKREWQSPVRGSCDVEFLVAAKTEIPVLQMHIRMAHATAMN